MREFKRRNAFGSRTFRRAFLPHDGAREAATGLEWQLGRRPTVWDRCGGLGRPDGDERRRESFPVRRAREERIGRKREKEKRKKWVGLGLAGRDIRGEGRHPKNASELFNLCHASLRNVIERIFGIFKSRFTIFKVAPPFPFQTQAELVLACAGLHNFLRKECCSDEFPIELEDDQSPSHLDMEDENFELLSQSQLQQRTKANAWRTSIANAMWARRPRNDDDEDEEDSNEDQDDVIMNNEESMVGDNQEIYDVNEVEIDE
ncbi:hypothetical protein ACLB2K_037869 [Fragaria x ananassa]